jgi:hypothetical protein
MQPDPIGLAGGDLNLYRYCRNNPVNWVDRLGLDTNLITAGGDIQYGYTQTGLNFQVGEPYRSINPRLAAVTGIGIGSIAAGAGAIVAGPAMLPYVARVLPPLFPFANRAKDVLEKRGAITQQIASSCPQISQQTTRVTQPMLAAIDKSGQVITSPNLMLPHASFAQQVLGATGSSLPPGTWVGTVGVINGQVVGLNSMTFFGNQLPASPQVQQAIQQALH